MLHVGLAIQARFSNQSGKQAQTEGLGDKESQSHTDDLDSIRLITE